MFRDAVSTLTVSEGLYHEYLILTGLEPTIHKFDSLHFVSFILSVLQHYLKRYNMHPNIISETVLHYKFASNIYSPQPPLSPSFILLSPLMEFIPKIFCVMTSIFTA